MISEKQPLFMRDRRWLGVREGDLEAATRILQDTRLLKCPNLVRWAQATKDRPPWAILSEAEKRTRVEMAQFVDEDPCRVRNDGVLVAWARAVVSNARSTGPHEVEL